MADIPHPAETTQNLPDLDVIKYNSWRDWSFNLQTDKVEVFKEEDEYKYGMVMFSVGQCTVLELRENNSQNDTPKIICTDEKTDEQVISEATSEERKKAFLEASVKRVRGWVYPDDPETDKQYYPTSVLALGSAMLDIDQEESKPVLVEKIKGSDLMAIQKELFIKALNNVSNERVEKLKDYLKFSQTQMTNNEKYQLETGLKEPPPITSSPLFIGGQAYEFEGQDFGGTALTQEDENILVPLMSATHRSRSEMIEQGIETARQIFDIQDEKIPKPPSWWVNGDSLQALSSKHVLIYAPWRNDEMSDEKTPNVYKEIYKSSKNRGGGF